MKGFTFLFLVIVLGCSNPGEPKKPEAVAVERSLFFPVTSYLQGQVTEMKSIRVNPLLTRDNNRNLDSVWVRTEQFDSIFRPFMQPEINDSNLVQWFKETKFLDQTLDAYTFTYEPTSSLPDTFALRRWDIYVDPQKNTVRRVYMEKKENEKTIQQTWQHNEWCKTVVISNDGKVLKQELVKWKF